MSRDAEPAHIEPSGSPVDARGEWTRIEWFIPSGASDEELTRQFGEHNALARHHSPELFAERVEVRCVLGGWSEFSAWCTRVRAQTRWDWRFSILKKLSHDHARARGWSLDVIAPRIPLGMPKPGDLFVRFDADSGKPAIVWNHFVPPIAFPPISHPPATEAAQFYAGHALGDLFNCIQWQLADDSADLTGNPFLPLMRCYGAGAYPFSLDRDTVVLFRFSADEARLPRATILPTRS